MMANELSPKERVLAEHKTAMCWWPWVDSTKFWIVVPPRNSEMDIGLGTKLSDFFDTEEEAWQDAADKLEACLCFKKSPEPTGDDPDTCKVCGEGNEWCKCGGVKRNCGALHESGESCVLSTNHSGRPHATVTEDVIEAKTGLFWWGSKTTERKAPEDIEVVLPPRPESEHMKQFASALFSFSYIQYPEFQRWAEECECQLKAEIAAIEKAEKERDQLQRELDTATALLRGYEAKTSYNQE